MQAATKGGPKRKRERVVMVGSDQEREGKEGRAAGGVAPPPAGHKEGREGQVKKRENSRERAQPLPLEHAT